MTDKNDVFEFLDELRDSGSANMWGASGFVREEFPDIENRTARDWTLEWMKHPTRHKEENRNG